jgi:hypothetical protein
MRHNPGFGIASKVVGGDSGDANRGCVAPEHLPDDLFAEALGSNAAVPFH